MAIYPIEALPDLARPTSIPEAAAAGAIKALCRAAPYVAGYGLLTGNLPAVAYGAGADIACGLPLFPMPDPVPPPQFLPQDGGCLPIRYNVVTTVVTHSPDCQANRSVGRYNNIQGPVGRASSSWGMRSFTCREGAAYEGFNCYLTTPGGPVFLGVYFPGMGGTFSVVATPVSGNQNSSDCVPFSQPVLPPGILPPPGYPENPQLPGFEAPIPIYPPGQPTAPPDRWVPIKIPPIPLPPVIVPVVPISVPINIPVSIPVSFNPNISGQITIQVGPKGEIRTPPDLICPCEVGEPDKPVPTCPETTMFEIPWYSCGDEPGFKVATIEVVRESLPVDLFNDLLSSSNLAEIGCESSKSKQAPAVFLERGRTGDIMVRPYFSNVLPEEVVSVELRITEFSPAQHRELTTFPGAGQIKFGSVSYCIEGLDGGDNPTYIWDKKTYIRLPKRLKPGRLKVLLRESITFELWDTGERV